MTERPPLFFLAWLAPALLWALLLLLPEPAIAQGDVFETDDGGGTTGLNACTDKCVTDFADGVWGDPPCANFGLERCVHQCYCDVDPDCGPEPKHPEEEQYCPMEELPDGGSEGSKGLTRRQCEEAEAKGIVREGCGEFHKQDCLEDGAKGLFRKDCAEIVRKDCEEAGEKGLTRVDCGNLQVFDCLENEAKGIHRPDCQETLKKRESECDKEIGPDPVAPVERLVARLDQCLVEESTALWYQSPTLVTTTGDPAFHEPGTRSLSYDPAALEAMSLYDKTFFLAYAYADYFMDLEAQRLGTERPTEESSSYQHEIAGFLAHCLAYYKLYPKQVTLCPDARHAHQQYLATSQAVTGSDEDPAAAQVDWDAGWASYGGGVPGALRHVPSRDVIEWAQEILADLGYQPGRADGFMGPRTAAAVKAFEEAHSLEPTGVLHEKVLDLLVQEAASLPGAPAKPLR